MKLTITKPIAVIRKYIGSVTPSIPMPDLLILRYYLILNKHTMSLIVLASSPENQRSKQIDSWFRIC